MVVADDFTTFDAKLHRLLEWKRSLSSDMLNGVGDLSQNDFGDLENVGGGTAFDNTPITAADIVTMRPDAFEGFCTVLWSKLGFKTKKMGGAGDGGIDVVAINGNKGVLIQCKSSSIEGQALGWDAVKEVVAGAAAYEIKHSGVTFKKVAVTNQRFNSAAKEQAHLNGVDLVDCSVLEEMLKKYPVSRYFIL